jgi:outer membrane immunogenic protein
MKNVLGFVAAGVVSLVTIASASADGLPQRRASIKDAFDAPRCASFRGFYAGAHLGWAFYRADRHDHDAFLGTDDPATRSASDDGVAAGLQAGYNHQRGCMVLGLEADVTWVDLDTDFRTTTGNVSSNIDWLGTVRGRAGVVVDSLLLYLTAGLAYAEIDTRWSTGAAAVSFSDTRWGWTVGAGVEWALASNISLKTEVLYITFEDERSSAFAAGANRRFGHDDEIWTTRVGLNFRFGN